MQAFDPRRRAKITEKRPFPWKAVTALLSVVVICLVVGTGIWAASSLVGNNKKQSPQNEIVNSSAELQPASKKGTLKNFTGAEFRDLYNSFAYPNTERISEKTPITGNETADNRIKTIAEQRGYRLRSAPVTNAFVEVEPTMQLQQRAAQPWKDMQNTSAKEGINIGLSAAYRSAEDQKQIFMDRLSQLGITVDGIAAGYHDAQLSQVLRSTAIPGYSRHHNGYAIDITCENQPTYSFEYTVCFDWLSKENYKNAKQHGWIPSYPEGAGEQGPDPESWEYVWVGVDALTE